MKELHSLGERGSIGGLIMRKRYIFAILLSLVFLLSACGSQNDIENTNLTVHVKAEAVEEKEPDEEFIAGTSAFSVDLFREESKDLETDENILISPYSVLSALAMTANGAQGDTLDEMELVLCDGMNIENLNAYLYSLRMDLASSESVAFHTANSIWIKDREDFKVRDSFLQTEKNYYNADAFLVPMNEDTVEDINDWVNENTKEMIPTLLNEIPEDVVMYLINALAFEGEWEVPYERDQIIEDSTFVNGLGEKENVTMLHSDESWYLYDDKCTGFLKYYKDGRFAFMAILPDEGYSVNDYLEGMTGESYQQLFDSRMEGDVDVKMPEFSYEYDTQLKETLNLLGIEKAFADSADFSNMADVDELLFISQVVHKTFIQVDREGTEAAAVSSINMAVGCAPEEGEPLYVYLNRPFLYAIVDTETGIPIFTGVVNTVEKK